MPKKQVDQATSVKRSKSGKRLLTAPRRIWYRPLTWQYGPPKPQYKPMPKARILFWTVLGQLKKNWKLFGGIVLIYGILNIILVRGLAGSSDLTNLKSALDSGLQGFDGKLVSTATTFTYLVASSGNGSTDTSSVYQTMLFILCSLAFIWAFRQVMAARTVRVRDSFYHGMYPLVPFLLLFLLLGVQLIPMAIGAGLYSMVTSGGIAVHLWEKAFFLALLVASVLWSLRMATATIFGIYIVALPDMTPIRAYRSARQLVYKRRLIIWRKLLFLTVAMLLLAAAIELPLIAFLTPLAVWTFFIINMLALPIVHGYLYNLYREML